jgi:hypothetical protein
MTRQRQSKRATFEDTGLAQDKIRKYIDRDLIKDNKLLDEKHREHFIKIYREATLGIGGTMPFFYAGKIKTYKFPNMDHVIFWLLYRTTTQITMTTGEKIEARDMWISIRDKLFELFPQAINLSIKISQEQIKLSRSLPEDV